MDSNGLNFRMLSTAADWLPAAGSDVLFYCPASKRLQLRSTREGGPLNENFATAQALVEIAPMTRDQFGNYARWDAASRSVVAGGAGAGEVPIYTPPAGEAVTDLAMGTDGVLYAALAGTLVLIDRRNRWANVTLAPADFIFWRLTTLPEGGVVALDRVNQQLGWVHGLPRQIEPTDPPNPGVMQPCQPNTNPPQVVSRIPLPSTETFVALAAMSAGTICLLSWASNTAANKTSFLRTYSRQTGLGSPWTFSETAFPYAVAWLQNRKLAVFAANVREALIYDLQGAPATLAAAGDTYILQSVNPGPFVHSFDTTPWYASGAGPKIYPLVPLSLNSLARSGQIQCPAVFDSGSAETIWHRLYIEAILPPRCGFLVWVAASNTLSDFNGGKGALQLRWHPHTFGEVATAAPLVPGAPQGSWVSTASEVPFARPLLSVPPVKDRQGLFMVLVQSANTAVRTVTGRYLGFRIQLNGDRRSTPEIAALRVYNSRFSYVNNYLPELYRENKYGPDADVHGDSTRRDFFERFVNIFEAQMTRIEDRIASAYLLTRPESTPDSALDWLGGWIGVESGDYPPDRKRARLMAAPGLHRKRGTVSGIIEALNLATNGLCDSGAVLVLEDFRLRHIFATILGADLEMKSDPLLPGYTSTSNSFVGNTLFLGNPRNPDFLAMFAESVALPQEQQQVQHFLDSLANRITVFIHDRVQSVNLNLVRQIVEREKPAHVAATYRTAAQPFMIGLASLLGANTYLAPEPPLDPVVVNVSQVGRYNVIQHVPSLDPRWENGEANVV